jgi:hypothetical protein
LISEKARVAHECLIESLRASLGLPEASPGEYLHFHFHLDALVGDGLFRGSSASCPSPVSSPWRSSSAHG